jgi:hypothetical protein
MSHNDSEWFMMSQKNRWRKFRWRFYIKIFNQKEF